MMPYDQKFYPDYEMMPQTWVENIHMHHVDSKVLIDKMHMVIDCLRPRQKKILMMRYGHKKYTYQQIGASLNISKARAHAIHEKIIYRLGSNPNVVKYLQDFLYLTKR